MGHSSVEEIMLCTTYCRLMDNIKQKFMLGFPTMSVGIFQGYSHITDK